MTLHCKPFPLQVIGTFAQARLSSAWYIFPSQSSKFLSGTISFCGIELSLGKIHILYALIALHENLLLLHLTFYAEIVH